MPSKIKFRNSLLSRYLVIIGMALIFIPILIPISLAASWGTNQLLNLGQHNPPQNKYNPLYKSGNELAHVWHENARLLNNKTTEEINSRIHELKQSYPEASLFWVDAAGNTQIALPKQDALPEVWTLSDTIQFMKTRVNADPFTVVAFIGGESSSDQGFMVLELSRSYMKTETTRNSDSRLYGFFIMLMFLIFLLVSYLFIRDIRKRLLRLEFSMTRTGANSLPSKTIEGRPDEIGQLEQAFNHMVDELEDSRNRELEEETLRKDLISNLSHDLRTPLTVLGSHLYSLRKEPLSKEGLKSLALMENKIDDLDGLIDHLLSYNLLSSGRYEMNLQQQDILRIVRESAAAWYTLWERVGFEVDINLPEESVVWEVDEQGFRRILDNLFQNLIRHASSGQYVGIFVTKRKHKPALVIEDHGPGFDAPSPASGAGLGLLIVDMLLQEMGLRREIETSATGTSVYIIPAD